jgi:hypothetical protein
LSRRADQPVDSGRQAGLSLAPLLLLSP